MRYAPVVQLHLAHGGVTREADVRVLDYAADGSLVGVETLSPSRGADLTGIPRSLEVADALHRLGFLVRSPLPRLSTSATRSAGLPGP